MSTNNSGYQTNRVCLARNVAYALGAALFALLAISIVNAQVWPLVIDIGGRDARFTYGFHDPEIDANSETRFRWSDGDSTIAVPRPPVLAPLLLIVRLSNSRPTHAPLPRVTLTTDGRELALLTPPNYYPRTYRLIIPPNERLDWAVRIGIISDTISTPTDTRAMGIVVDTVIVAPLRTLVILPSLWVTLCVLFIGGLGYTLLRLLSSALHSAFVISLSLAALIALITLLYPLETLPFTQRFAFLLAAGTVGGLLLRLFIPLIHEHDPSAPRLVGAHVPIAMAIVWWMSPLAQWLISSDGAPLPPQPVIWIGAGTIASLLIVRFALRRRLHDRVQAAVLLILSLSACAHLVYSIAFAYTRQAPDFWILFRGAREWTRGGSMYDIEAVLTNHFGHVFKVPPFYGMLFVPFVTMDGLMVLLGHRIMNTILIVATALLWLRMWRIPLVSLDTAGLLIVFNFRPLADTLAYGQIDLVLLLLLTLALWALRSGRDTAAGALVALGTLFKIYPILLLAFFVMKGHWRALAGFVAAMVVCNGIAIAVIGWDEHLIYLTRVLPNIGSTTSWVENQTISGFLARLTDSPRNATIYQNDTVQLLGSVLSGIVSLVACALALRPTSRDSTGYALQYSMFLLLMVLASPAAWMHYETLLIVPFGNLILHLRERSVSLSYAALLALSFALIAHGNQWSFYDGTIHGILTIAGVSYKFYGMLLLGGVLAFEALREPAPALLSHLARLIAHLRHKGMSAGV